MKRISAITFIIFSLLAVCFTMGFRWMARNENFKKPLSFKDTTANYLAYKKDSFEVHREWIKISNTEMTEHVSAFIYYPVLSAETHFVEILPNSKWQLDHYEKVRKKVGDSLARIMMKKTLSLAKGAELPNKKMPLIVFGPGLGWLPTDYTYLLASLASRGYMVVAITGVPISKQVYFPDHTTENTDRVQADYRKMAAYFSLALSEILKKQENKEGVYGFIDTSKLMVMGHSISGAATLMAANTNHQIKGLINLDGDVNEEFKKIHPTQPILYITTQPLEVSSTNVETWHVDKNEVRRDHAFVNNSQQSIQSIRIKIPEMYHADFLDVAQYKKEISPALKGKNYGRISFQTSSEIMIASIIHFMEKKDDWKMLENKYGIYIQIR